ncbi:MAG: trypsin-like peptidase domain-containing protein [Armatimonadetes bacterium]|nr:trypsin-like peptidase domain-containing protein [Armatimonadota bacterium]
MNPRENAAHRHSHLALILLSVLVGAVLTALILAQTDHSQPVLTPAAAQQQGATQFADVAQRVLPAVVYINSDLTPRTDQRQEEMRRRLEELFRDMPGFRGQMPGGRGEAPRSRPAAGSGWIYSPDGHIVTNAHVVRGATRVTVQLHDRDNDMKEYPAKIVGIDPRSELAVIKIDAGRQLPTLSLGDSTAARIASWVMAVGSPFQLQQTVTVGVISARNRTISAESQYFELGDLIQTDASINPGNSGGPLVNDRGEVIGINVAIASPGATSVPVNIGIGFAIPSNVAKTVVPQLVQKGKVARGWLGVVLSRESEKELSANLRQYYGVPDGGVIVAMVTEGAPSAKVLQENDVIVSVNGQPVHSNGDLQALIANSPPGTKINMEVVRSRKKLQLAVELGEMPARYAGLDDEGAAPADKTPVGPPIQVRDITPQLARERSLCRTQGVFVESVGEALQDRVEVGDVIAQVDEAKIASVAQYNAAIRKAMAAKRDFVVLTVERIGVDGKVMRDVVDVPLAAKQP